MMYNIIKELTLFFRTLEDSIVDQSMETVSVMGLLRTQAQVGIKTFLVEFSHFDVTFGEVLIVQ